MMVVFRPPRAVTRSRGATSRHGVSGGVCLAPFRHVLRSSFLEPCPRSPHASRLPLVTTRVFGISSAPWRAAPRPTFLAAGALLAAALRCQSRLARWCRACDVVESAAAWPPATRREGHHAPHALDGAQLDDAHAAVCLLKASAIMASPATLASLATRVDRKPTCARAPTTRGRYVYAAAPR